MTEEAKKIRAELEIENYQKLALNKEMYAHHAVVRATFLGFNAGYKQGKEDFRKMLNELDNEMIGVTKPAGL